MTRLPTWSFVARPADDLEAATALDLELPRHQVRSPVFSPVSAD